MDWPRRKSAMKPLKRNPEESHDLMRPTDGMELKAGTSLLMDRGWISRKNLVAGQVFFLTSFLIERKQAFSQACAFSSLKSGSIGEMGILRQPRQVPVFRSADLD